MNKCRNNWKWQRKFADGIGEIAYNNLEA